MAPLSRDLAGLILPHDSFGSHLNNSLKCIDVELEKRNFQKAGQVLSEVWSGTLIDGEPVLAQYVDPETVNPIPHEPSEQWKTKHVRASQYLLQVVKCDDENCCSPRRSTISNVLPGRFLPSPVLFSTNQKGVFVAEVGDTTAHFGSLQNRALLSSLVPVDLPFDYFCPSVQTTLDSRQCKTCSIYHCSLKALASHRRDGCLTKGSKAEEFEIECDIEDVYFDNSCDVIDSESNTDTPTNSDIPILSLDQFLSPLFEDVN